MDLVASAALESRDDILGGRLEQSDNVCDKLLFALDGDKLLESVCAIDRLLDESTLEDRLLVCGGELLDDLSGRISDIGEHYSRVAGESGVEVGELAVYRLYSLLDEGVLDDHELDVPLEAETTQRAGLLGVESLDVNEVEVGIALERLNELVNECGFIFFSHDSDLKGKTIN